MIVDLTDAGTVWLRSLQQPSGLPIMLVSLIEEVDIWVDPSRQQPASISFRKPTAETWTVLETIMASPPLWSLQDILKRDDGARTVELDFAPGPRWADVRELGQLLWDLHWNPLAHDKALLALDLIRLQHRTQDITHNPPNPAFVPVALPAVLELKEQRGHHRLDPHTERLLSEALAAAPVFNEPTMETIRHLRPALTPAQIAQTLEPRKAADGALLTGTPDWRLTGHGPALTSADSIQVTHHAQVPEAITVTVPTKPGTNPENTPSYEATLSTPGGRLLATTSLNYDSASSAYVGHTHVRRTPSTHDHIDLRHPENTIPARQDAYQDLQAHTCRYLQMNPTHSLLTQWQANQQPATNLHQDEFDWFLFELSTREQTGVTRGSERGHAAGDTAEGPQHSFSFKAKELGRTIIEAYFETATDGTEDLVLIVRNFPTSGEQIHLTVTLEGPGGGKSVRTTETLPSRKSTTTFKLRSASPEMLPVSIALGKKS